MKQRNGRCLKHFCSVFSTILSNGAEQLFFFTSTTCDFGSLGDRYREFLAVVKEGQGEVEQVTRLRGLVFHLPMVHYHTLRYLTLHLNKVADHAEENKVGSYEQTSHCLGLVSWAGHSL